LHQNVIVSLRDCGALHLDLVVFDVWMIEHDPSSKFGWPAVYLMRHPAIEEEGDEDG
jgi:hypothetical protein